MQKICQNCKREFTIELEDFKFYEKLAVPPPTFCWLCRAQRRFIWRNERFLFKRKSDFSGKEIFSMFPQESYPKVYENDIWFSDKWDPMEYGRDVDFSRSFLAQFFDLLNAVPHMALSVISGTMVNSDYSNNAGHLKNCYLVFNADNDEDCMYSDVIHYSKDCVDVLSVTKSEFSYQSFWIDHSARVFFSSQCENSYDIYFSKNLRECSNCFGCINLRTKSYYIFNKSYSKEWYEEKMKKYNLGSHEAVELLKEEAAKFYLRFPHKFREGRANVNATGEYISNSKNVFQSYQMREVEDARYCQFFLAPASKNCMDHTIWGIGNSFTYECVVCGDGTNNIKFCSECWSNVNNLQYCRCIQSSSYCFGCVNLKNKKYCILNKQYLKEEYEALVPKIIEHMEKMPYQDKKGRVYRYGEFFPAQFSPFAYNQTIAQEHFPLKKEEALLQGYLWKDTEEKNHAVTKQAKDLPDHINEASKAILSEVIGCLHGGMCTDQCTGAFRIIPQELAFYKNLTFGQNLSGFASKKMNLPLPRLCPNCRHYERIQMRNPLRLWHRRCMCQGPSSADGVYRNSTGHFHGTKPCPNEFETSYSSERPEIVYCEKCYLAEVV